MSDYQPHSGYAPLSLVEAYWDALRAGREMPKRAEIDPRGIESALEYAFILERVAPGVARLRIAGGHLQDIMGMEARGMPLTSFFEQESRMKVSGILEEVFQTPATAELTLTALGSLGQPELEARMILLPLKSDLGDVSRILGCLVCVGDLGAVPRRFDLSGVQVRRLDSGMMPAPQIPTPLGSQPAEFAENAPRFTGQAPRVPETFPEQGGPKKRPPYLRLIRSKD